MTVVFLVFSAAVDRLPPLSQAVSIAVGLLVMVSSELVVLLIVCVGINTGSAQQGELAKEAFTQHRCIPYLDNAELSAS